MRLRLGFLSVLALSLAAPQALAWGKTGHRVTGAIAESHLSGDARAAITGLLGTEDLAEASTWPDFMRSADATFWRWQASPWHYVTVPEGDTYADAGAPDQGDAITALAQFRETLRDRDASAEDRRLALRFAVHIIGDLHQPLHAGNGTDRGGNDFTVSFFGAPTNLHGLWDTGLIDHEQLSYTELTMWLTRRLTPADVASWWVTDPEIWIAESTAIRDTIYPDADGDRELRWNYVFTHRDTVRRRLAMGGVRIAAWLNETFAEAR
ncbi:MAG: S1/P1 nuclease [Pseudomonadota bacterium]